MNTAIRRPRTTKQTRAKDAPNHPPVRASANPHSANGLGNFVIDLALPTAAWAQTAKGANTHCCDCDENPVDTPPWWPHSKDEPVEYRQTGAVHARRTRASTHGGVLGLRVKMGRSQSHRHHRHQTAATVVAQRQQLTPRCPRSSTHSAPCSTTAKPSSAARSSNSDPTVRQNSRRDTAAPGSTVINTDHWTERWPDHPVIRTFDEPRAVNVDIGRALPLGRGEHGALIM